LEILLRESFKKKHPDTAVSKSDQPIYNQPKEFIFDSVAGAIDRLLGILHNANEKGFQVAFIHFHALFSSMNTLENFAPYLPSQFRRITNVYESKFITLVDDIYDVHKTLSESNYLIRLDNDWRNPSLDFLELERILEWRKSDHIICQLMANDLACQHLLVHFKTPCIVFWRMSVDDVPPIYLSHSISQPRRHWIGIPHKKCPDPKEEIGDEFAEEVNEIGRRLVENGFALQEPTCIDEYRIDYGCLKETKLEDLHAVLLPPKSKPWKLRNEARLLQQNPDTGVGFTKSDAAHLEETFDVKQGVPGWTEQVAEEAGQIPRSLLSLSSALESEILRQITARDYALTAQSKAVVVYRPFSNHSYPEISGGVKDEINCCLALQEGNKEASIRLFILHPFADEKKRRTNVLLGYGTEQGVLDKAWHLFCNGSLDQEKKDSILGLFDRIPYEPNQEWVVLELRKVVKDWSYKAGRKYSAMKGESVVGSFTAGDAFIQSLADAACDVDILIGARLDNPMIKLYDSKEVGGEILADIKNALGL
jgi:hypothetical protein